MNYKLFTDGGSRGNPGHAAIGFVCQSSDGITEFEGNRYIGTNTNNYAEYMAIIAGLQACLLKDIKNVECYLDSELVVKQLKGEYKQKNEGLKPLFDKVKELTKKFNSITFTHVPRNQNKRADALVNEALDEAGY